MWLVVGDCAPELQLQGVMELETSSKFWLVPKHAACWQARKAGVAAVLPVVVATAVGCIAQFQQVCS